MADAPTLLSLYPGWPRYQALLVEMVAPLTPAHLALRAAPTLRPAWELAAHIIAARVYWFQRVLGEGEPALATLQTWDDPGQPARAAAELVAGLEQSWQLMQAALGRWTPADLGVTAVTTRGTTVTRGWVVWHVVEHDLHHGGELSLTLGLHGLATPDL